MKAVKLWRLAVRLLTADPLQTALVLAVCVSAGLAAFAFAETSARANDRVAREMIRAYGDAVVRRPVAAAADIDFPHLAHRPNEPLTWIRRADYDEVVAIATGLGYGVSARIRGVAGVDGRVVEVIAVGDADPAVTSESVRAPHPRLAFQPDDSRVEYVEIPEHAIRSFTLPDGPLRVDSRWLGDLLFPDRGHLARVPFANELAIWAEQEDPFVLAFDLQELLRERLPGITVTPWPEAVGVERYLATQTTSLVERTLVLIVAALAVGAISSVSARNRLPESVLLCTIGFTPPAVQGVFTRQMAIVGIASALVVAIVVVAFGALWGVISESGLIIRTLVSVVVIPPTIAFLVVRRELQRPLKQLQRNAQRESRR